MRRLAGPFLVVTLLGGVAARAEDASADGGVPPPSLGTVVSALRLPRPERDATSSVTVLGAPEIARSPELDADDVLRTVPSVETFRRSSSLVADPTSQGLSLRSLGPSAVSRALVLLDGVPLNDPFGGWVYWQSLSLLDVDRIEIAPSSASALYGNFGLGGMAQVISKPITRDFMAELSGGSFGTSDARVRMATTAGPWAGVLFGEFLTTGGYDVVAPYARGPIDQPAASTHGTVGTRMELKPTERLTLSLSGRFFDEDEHGGTTWTHSMVRMGTGALSLKYDAEHAGSWVARVFGLGELFVQTRGRVAAGRSTERESGEQRVPSQSQGASVVWTAPASLFGPADTLLIGLDVLRVLGVSQEQLFPAAPGPTALVGRSSGGEQLFAGVFAEDVLDLGTHWEISGAVRADFWRSQLGSRTTELANGTEAVSHFEAQSGVQASPKVGVRYKVNELVSLRASGYRGFRVPTLNELYRPFQVGTVLTDGNQALRPESLLGAEVGPQLYLGTATLKLSGFWNDLRDPISNVTLSTPLVDGATRQRQNLGEARVRGFDFEVDWRICRQLLATGGYTFADSSVLSASTAPQLVGKQLAQSPQHRGVAALTFLDPRWLTLTVQTRFNGPQFEDDQNQLPMAGYVLADARVSKSWGEHLEVFALVENIFDRQYLVGRAGVDTIGQPRTFRAGVQLH